MTTADLRYMMGLYVIKPIAMEAMAEALVTWDANPKLLGSITSYP